MAVPVRDLHRGQSRFVGQDANPICHGCRITCRCMGEQALDELQPSAWLHVTFPRIARRNQSPRAGRVGFLRRQGQRRSVAAVIDQQIVGRRCVQAGLLKVVFGKPSVRPICPVHVADVLGVPHRADASAKTVVEGRLVAHQDEWDS